MPKSVQDSEIFEWRHSFRWELHLRPSKSVLVQFAGQNRRRPNDYVPGCDGEAEAGNF